MDINKTAFYPKLLDILKDISESHFVTFDLELSGVCSRANTGRSGKPSLQERYVETKEAAERYQILQFGLTCVQQDNVNRKYVLKPYNFNISPVIDDHRRLNIERIFSYQSSAVDFLHSVGFNMGKSFTEGIPYLSRSESRQARADFEKRNKRDDIADIQIKPTDTEALALLDRVRLDINMWLSDKRRDAPVYIHIRALSAGKVDPGKVQPELTAYEKRLVHQLVRAEYPGLITIGRQGTVQIVHQDKEREDRFEASRKQALSERINRQKGFRWVIEALLGNDIGQLDLRECAKDAVTGMPIFHDTVDMRIKFDRARDLMRSRPRILVGHNCFLDLVYVYRQFIGPLPDTVVEFQNKLHSLWPVVVDTKYMATHNCGDISPMSSLEQIAQALAERATPESQLHNRHTAYHDREALHEAGYDSYLTAQVAIKLSSKLEAEGAYVDIDRLDSSGDDSNGGVRLGAKPVSRPTSVEDTGFAGGMPSFGSDFWRVYGNKLRVFGVEEGVCNLS